MSEAPASNYATPRAVTTYGLMHRLGRIPPAEAEAEARYYSQLVTGRPAGSQNPEGA
ncbi:hypothetical protein MMRN_36330 [Mycobacterium marinum]|nr:hypothetical protein CCUG20998_03333 [Mycobacterium marinum]EPQ75135.1 hypothetical protein MMEU_2795 [Mycobacterium marinum str. Europe]RFZ19352.1 hypothetical protein DSM43519_04023 [Mycobacterium marinum]RFZ21359.1 hypothetical protein DSM44344_03711 [Mycobacterium marinum]RFZ27472.1 hypothetical protein NCTC2275_04534 [Mycobacterium marinum]